MLKSNIIWAWLIGWYMLLPASVMAFPTDEQIIAFNNSVVKVHVNDKNGNHGIGSGFVVSENHVATNCHVIANSRSARVAKEGRLYDPVGFKADWHHDLCILKFDDLPLKPLPLGDSAALNYEQEVLVLGFPNNSPRPQPTVGYIKALYPFEDSNIIRTSAGFRLGASGGPLLDMDGKVIGITAFKSPGRYNSFYYSLPVQWLKQLLTQPDVLVATQSEAFFWDVPEQQRPYFMRVVEPSKAGMWSEVQVLANSWITEQPLNCEPWYYLGMAEYHLQNVKAATLHLQKAIALNSQHAAAYLQLGLIAAEVGNQEETQRIRLILSKLDPAAFDALNQNAMP